MLLPMFNFVLKKHGKMLMYTTFPERKEQSEPFSPFSHTFCLYVFIMSFQYVIFYKNR